MSANTPDDESSGFAFVIILTLLVIFNINPSRSDINSDIETSRLKYKIARFYGAELSPSKSILDKEAERIAYFYGIDSKLFRALIRIESGINQFALSPVGARGVAQIMPFNAKRCGLNHPDELFDAISNLQCGAQILSEEIEEHGDVHKALTVYNCGKVRCPAGKIYASKVIALSKKLS